MQFLTSTDSAVYTTNIVATALKRSLGHTPKIIPFDGGLVIPCGEASSWANGLFCGKILVLGKPAASMMRSLGLKNEPALPSLAGQDACPPARADLPFTESPAFLHYERHSLLAGLATHMHRRAFTRFDYEDEWNNLGFGRIRTDNSPWAAQGGITSEGAVALASIHLWDESRRRSRYAGCYLSLHDTPTASVMWCGRPVGPVDSTEWTIIERFISDWRSDEMPCLPSLKHSPAGCRCLVTMRLDCDEDVASARDVFDWYSGEGIPFSLALKTSLDLKADDLALLRAVSDAGGTVLSHSHMHQFCWGPTPEAAVNDAATSRKRFAELFPSLPAVELAVSPFHTNPPYAVQAMAETGFTGFVSGIIHNDPEYLLGRAGVVPLADNAIISISQQSMLHGDCYRRQHNSIDVHTMAFESQYQAEGIWGYLDHPFSPRYQYDWQSKEQRLEAHKKLIDDIRKYSGVIFCSQKQCFEFVNALASIQLQVNAQGNVLVSGIASRNDLAYRFKGKEHLIVAAAR